MKLGSGRKAWYIFFTKEFGLPVGKKYDKLRIPHQLKGSDELITAFIQSLADTDFSLTLKRGTETDSTIQ